MRKPDNMVWCFTMWCFGWYTQKYGYNASCTTICFGPLTLRWHKR